jgi:hypothetical protein
MVTVKTAYRIPTKRGVVPVKNSQGIKRCKGVERRGYETVEK